MTGRLLAEIWRWAQLIVGWLLLILGPLIGGPFPGPFGIVGFAAGLVLVLRNSRWARRRFIRLKRRYPDTLGRVRHVLKHGVNVRGMFDRLRNKPTAPHRRPSPRQQHSRRPVERDTKPGTRPRAEPAETGEVS